MKKTLFIGSSVVDLVITVDHLPGKAQDVNVLSRTVNPGGCAFNASSVYQQLGCPFTLFSPVGTGIYGDFVRQALLRRGITPAISVDNRENGMCLCFVERDGERTFICDHGAEYFFKSEWFDSIDSSLYDSVYVCGLEIEEKTGAVIIDFLEQNPQLPVYFSPGPRIMHIPPENLNRILQLHPVLHINETEAIAFADIHVAPGNQGAAEKACAEIFRRIGNMVIVTLGSRGACFCNSGDVVTVPGVSANVVDTIGAGDAHIGAVIALQKKGYDLENCIAAANVVAAAVTEVRGAVLPDNHPVFSQIAVN